MKKELLSRKRLSGLFYSLCLMLCVNLGWGQQQILGYFPSMDGGFEAGASSGPMTSGSIASGITSSVWTTSSSALATFLSASPRTGTKYVNFVGGSTKRLQSPTFDATLLTNTQYTVQYYYRTTNNTSTGAFMQIGASIDGTNTPTYFPSGAPYTNLPGTSNVWTKYAAQFTLPTGGSSSKYGIGIIRTQSPIAVSLDIDDVVMYAGTLDEIAPDAPTSPTIPAAAASQQTVSWTAPGTGVDGGGYMVVRGLADPTTAVNQNGIYAVGNFVAGSEKVVYLGTSSSFTDLGLTPSTTYYYRIYTVDKAFNYSAAATVSGTTTAPSYASEPTGQVSGLSFSNISSSGMTINWAAGNGTNSLVVVRATSAVDVDPTDGGTYAPNTVYGTGTQVGTGNYAVYNGTSNTVAITGLNKAITYYVKVYTFNGSAGTENYLIASPASGNQMALPGEIISNGTGGGSWSTGASWVGGIAPGQYDNVTIVSPDVINVTSTVKCNNLTINSGGKVWAPVTNSLQIYGSTLVCEGTLGDLLVANSLLNIEFGGNLNISGSGTIAPYRIRPVATLSNISVTFDAPITTVTYGTVGMLMDSGTNDNVTYTVNAGKTVNILGSFSSTSSSTGIGGGNTTVNLYGTINVTNNFNNTVAIGKTFATNIFNGGLLSVGKFNLSAAHQVQASTVTVVNAGGELRVTANGTALDCSHPTLTSYVTGGGTFTTSAGSTIVLGNTLGLDSTTGPIRTATRNFNANNNFSFVGTTAQVSGSDFPTTVNSLTINNPMGVTLGSATSMTGKLTLTIGTLATGGLLTLKSGDCCTSATVAPVTGGSVTGNVIVERNIPAGFRAYRLLSSPVTTAGTIQANWQEGGTGNPFPGFGTHITGTGTGFDATTSNASSLFTHNNASPSWIAATNTDITTLVAGSPYLIYIRGSRLGTNITSTTNDVTTLRGTGTLTTGTVAVSGLNATANGFSLVGNPYQAQVDMGAVLSASTNLNTGFYYVLEPKMGTKGTYVTVNAATGSNNSSGGSTANQYLQPWQACFVQTVADGAASLSFLETNKFEGTQTSVFRKANTISRLSLALYDTAKLAQNGYPLDGVVVDFDASESNAVNQNDALKMTNFDENMATSNSSKLLSIESRSIPTDTDEIPLNITKYKGTSYTIKAEGTGLTGPTPYLFDQFANTTTEIPQDGSVNYAYTVDTAIPASAAADRFKLIYAKTLKTIDNAVEGFALYPNPSKVNSFSVVVPQSMSKASLSVSNLLGQQLYSQSDLQSGATAKVTVSNVKTAGVYLVRLTSEGKTVTTKWIVE